MKVQLTTTKGHDTATTENPDAKSNVYVLSLSMNIYPGIVAYWFAAPFRG